MAIEREELKKKTLAAASAEEVMEIMKAAGKEITAEEAAQLFEKVQAQKMDKELSLDELEAVSGGVRDWVTEGCAATVEWDSDCWGEDGGCIVVHYTYTREPTTKDRCPKCGARVYYEGEYGVSTGFLEGYNWKEFICRNCGSYKVKDDGTIF